MKIRSFRHKGLKRLFLEDVSKGLPSAQSDKLKDMLFALSEAEEIAELEMFPGWRLHGLKGNRKGHWSMTVTGNWRLVFRLEGKDVYDIDFIDYH